MVVSGAVGHVQVHRLTLRADDLSRDFNLLQLVPPEGTPAWVTGTGQQQVGIVGLGTHTCERFTGRERFSRAQRWWAQSPDPRASTDDGHGWPAFMGFSFSPDGDDSIAVVTEHVVRRHGDELEFLTTDAAAADDPVEFLRGRLHQHTTPGHSAIDWQDGSQSLPLWQQSVARAVARIDTGALDKVVLARSIVGTADSPVDIGAVLRRLNSAYASCWTFFLDGWLGATPELLVSRSGKYVHSRVLAGTVKRSADQFLDGDLAAQLLDSSKDLAEHDYAVRSVADVLSAHCTDLCVPTEPSILQLANVQHLATDVSGQLADDAAAVALAGSLHPTAAVCGTPTERAAALIAELEPMDRSRYAAPVGWSAAGGDGEYGIALRCARVVDAERRRFELYAGCGIVSGSTPQAERAESEAKLQAMRRALTP